MTNHRILRTDNGYKCESLHASGLSARQSQVLLLRALGKPISECAQLLNCSQSNIKQLNTALFYKLRANSSQELITRAFQSGHLQFLSIFTAIFLALFAGNLPDHQSVARVGRVRTSAQLRVQRNTKNNQLMELV
jgi:DNA-binding CsgD family transcriptional regulator